MNKEQLINVSKNMVKEYFNRYIDKEHPITEDDIEVAGFKNNSATLWLLLSVPSSDMKLKYEVSYSKKTGQLHTGILGKDKGEDAEFKRLIIRHFENLKKENK